MEVAGARDENGTNDRHPAKEEANGNLAHEEKPEDRATAQETAVLPDTQLVFFLRHAESRWNRAQTQRNIVQMIAENDHGLSKSGRRQAEDLRQSIQRILRVEEASIRAEALATMEEEGGPSRLSRHSFKQEPASSLAEAEENDAAKVVKPKSHRADPPSALEQEMQRYFMHPDAVLCSPFTRAITTGCLALPEILPNSRMQLVKEVRERKNLGGMDSTGVAVGDDIPKRIEEELNYLYGDVEEGERDRVLADFHSVVLDVSEVMDEWWGGMMGDDESIIFEHAIELMGRVRRTRGSMQGGGGTTIVVGHSLTFRTVFQSCLPKPADPDSHEAKVVKSLKTNIIPCCGVIGMLFTWDELGIPSIVKVIPVMGTELTPAEEDDVEEAEDLHEMLRKVRERQTRASLNCSCGRRGSGECVAM